MILVGATLLWGLSFPLVKALGVLHQHIDPGVDLNFVTLFTLAPRFLIAAALLATVGLGRITAEEWKHGMIIGLFSGGGTFLQSDGLLYTTASASAFFTQFSAALIPCYLALRSRMVPSPLVLAAIILVLFGIAVLARLDPRDLKMGRGEVETLLCAVCFSGQILWIDATRRSGIRPTAVTFVMFATQALLFGAILILRAPAPAALLKPMQSTGWIAIMLVVAGFSTLGAYWLMNKWQPVVTATQAAIIYCFEPVFATCFALCLPGVLSFWTGISYENESLSNHFLIGGGAITIANILLNFRPTNEPRRNDP